MQIILFPPKVMRDLVPERAANFLSDRLLVLSAALVLDRDLIQHNTIRKDAGIFQPFGLSNTDELSEPIPLFRVRFHTNSDVIKSFHDFFWKGIDRFGHQHFEPFALHSIFIEPEDLAIDKQHSVCYHLPC